jgi:hypothetical protein
MRMRGLAPAGAGVVVFASAGGLEAASCSLMIALAASVPSAPQLGQFTRTGIRPLTGSTSNANFVSQPHSTLTFMAWIWD